MKKMNHYSEKWNHLKNGLIQKCKIKKVVEEDQAKAEEKAKAEAEEQSEEKAEDQEKTKEKINNINYFIK